MNYIAFEGIDGSGKSTQYNMQVERLKAKLGVDAVKEYTYSCKNNPVGRFIRKAYGQGTNHPLSFLTEKRCVQEGLYALNARANLRKVSMPKDGILLSDRSVVTAHASHVGLLPEWYVSLAEPNLIPDLAIFIEISPETGFSRIAERDQLFKEENMEGLEIFDRNYKTIFNGSRPRQLQNTEVAVIDGHRSLEAISEEVTSVVDTWLDKRGVRR